MAKKINEMTTEELLEADKAAAEKEKAAAESRAAIKLRLATQSIIDIVKTLRVPELFAKIREKTGNEKLDNAAR